MFCIVFEAKLWYCHQFFIVWKSNLWCFCIFCVVLEAKLRNYHMVWHFSSILHRVDHHFIMNMLFFLQFLHIFDPNLPTTPSVNWKFAVVSWLLGNHLHLKYGTSHAEKKKTWLSSQCCTNQRQKAWLYPQESEHKKCARRAKSNAPGRGCTRSKPWNKGLHQTKTCKQHVFIPRDQIALFLAVALYWAGPKCACVLWLTLVTSRRISETLLLRGTDIRVQGGEEHDAGHILFQRRPQDDSLGGSGKPGAEKVVARLSKDAIAGIQQLCSDGLEHELRPILEPFKVAVPLIFQMKPLNKDRFQLDTDSENFVFATASKKQGCRPNMSRQSVSEALKVIRKVMFQITGNRRYNPTSKFQGSRVTVHGATRHTSASLI